MWIAKGFFPGLNWLAQEDTDLKCWGVGTEETSRVSFYSESGECTEWAADNRDGSRYNRVVLRE